MDVKQFFTSLQHRPAHWHTAIPLEDPSPVPDDGPPSYFQIRLTDMYLTDERRWQQEIVPASFFLADYLYGGQQVRQPFFVSNQLLSKAPDSINTNTLRVRFRDTLLVGPTPYAGGDVGLFVGLFQCEIADRRKDLFSVFETLFSTFDPAGISQYVKMADKLSEEIFRCLGSEDMKCMLAERRVIGLHALPARGYLAFLRSRDGKVDTAGLVVRDGTLQRARDGAFEPVEDVDYCLVRIEQLAVRNDYSIMDFHRTWAQARDKKRAGQDSEAQALMLECARQVDASPDLSEDHKFSLIALYQSKLGATRALNAPAVPEPGDTRRAETEAPLREMQVRAAESNAYIDGGLEETFNAIAQSATNFSAAGLPDEPLDDATIAAHLRSKSETAAGSAGLLVQALTAGSMAHRHPAPDGLGSDGAMLP